jgi:branched-chain amino acid transport system ATP-binding protein
MTPALELRSLSRRFGGFVACDGVSVVLPPGGRHALIGPNGAGKSTLVNLITGRLRPSAGRIFLAGQDITGRSTSARVRAGLARNYQVSTLFPGFSLFENLALVIAERDGLLLTWRGWHGFPPDVVEEAEQRAMALRLADVGTRMVAQLPYGKQRLLELAMALARRPRVLLLDEPAAGLPGPDHALILDALDGLPEDVAVLLIEHDMSLVFRFARSVTVLAEGRVIAEGPTAEVRGNQLVREVYLGRAHAG